MDDYRQLVIDAIVEIKIQALKMEAEVAKINKIIGENSYGKAQKDT